MQIALTLVGPDADIVAMTLDRLPEALAHSKALMGEQRELGPGAVDILVERVDLSVVRRAVAGLVEGQAVDLCVQPAAGRRKALLIADMDSTIISCECIDELADYAGVKAKVAEITERAMRGELDFEAALRERVAMLRGLSVEVLQRAYNERVRLNLGAATLVKTMAAHGAPGFLVSGGFTFFTSRVMAAAGFTANRANELGQAGGVLTGLVGSPILGREAKLQALKQEAARLGVGLDAALAVGDGANDLAMIEAAGLGVAYRAKPVVAARADAKVDHADLTALLYFQGYHRDQFVTE